MKFLAFIIPALLPFAAFAAPTTAQSIHTDFTCRYEDQSTSISVEFKYDQDSDQDAQVSSKLIINDQEIPAQRPTCTQSSVPGRRGFLCSHQSEDGTSYDIYPQYELPQGNLTKASMIIWTESQTTTIHFTSCE
jgi:hypothetical protein